MPMPKTAVNEDRSAAAWHNDIGASRKVRRVNPMSEAALDPSSHFELWDAAST